MENKIKKSLAILMAFLMLLCAVPFVAGAEGEELTENGYTYTVENGEATITGSDENISGNIAIPSSIGGYPVRKIGWHAFAGRDDLTGVTIPNGVERIYQIAFNRCSNLKYISLPDSLTDIGSDVFAYCSSLEKIEVSKNNTVYHSKDNCLIKTEEKILIKGCKNSVIPNDGSVTIISHCAFAECDGLESITIPYGVTWIDVSAFSNCNDLISVTIADSVVHFSYDVFSGCSNLKNVKLSNSMAGIYEGAFSNCTSLERITIPCSVTYLYDSAFESCTSLKNITIPNGVYGIGGGAFFNCTGLTSVSIPESVTRIGIGAFDCCTSLTSITIPASVTEIGLEAFGYYNGKYGTERIPDFTIYGYAGTAAETYAKENEFNFVPLIKKEVKNEASGISIIYPDNAYDNDVELNVSVVTDGSAFNILNAEKENFKKVLFDITTTVGGEKVQPNGSVQVKIPLPKGYSAENTVVYYVTNDGKLEKMNSSVVGGYVIFETTHFSYYAVVEETEPSQPDNPSETCSCNCHKKGIANFFFKIILFFQKLFKQNKTCKCGVSHY